MTCLCVPATLLFRVCPRADAISAVRSFSALHALPCASCGTRDLRCLRPLRDCKDRLARNAPPQKSASRHQRRASRFQAFGLVLLRHFDFPSANPFFQWNSLASASLRRLIGGKNNIPPKLDVSTAHNLSVYGNWFLCALRIAGWHAHPLNKRGWPANGFELPNHS